MRAASVELWRPIPSSGAGDGPVGSAREERRADRGSGAVLVVAMVGVVLTVGVFVLALGGVRAARGRLDAAADLAALAGASVRYRGGDGCAAANEVARRHRVGLGACRTDGPIVEVVVSGEVRFVLGLGRFAVTSRARAGPVEPESVRWRTRKGCCTRCQQMCDEGARIGVAICHRCAVSRPG